MAWPQSVASYVEKSYLDFFCYSFFYPGSRQGKEAEFVLCIIRPFAYVWVAKRECVCVRVRVCMEFITAY